MFNTHQKVIGTYARQSPENMARVYQFVITTVQQALIHTPDMMHDIDENGLQAKTLWGWKYDAMQHATQYAQETYDTTMQIFRNAIDPDNARHELLSFFAGLPGLGLVKGGFMVQLCFGLSGCIDTHNLRRFNLTGNEFKAARFKNAKTDKTRNAIVRQYHKIVDACGGCEALWNDWCDYVAMRQPARYANGFEVSALHVAAIGA